MKKVLWVAGVVLGVVGATGCTNVQKGMGIGAAAGAGAGAAYGHYLSGAGGPTGAVVGAGVGGLGGALAAEHFYGEDEANIQEALAAQDALDQEKKRTDQLQEQVNELEKQNAALLAALDQASNSLNQDIPAEDDTPRATVDRKTLTLVVPFKSDVLFDSGKAQLSSGGRSEIHKAVQVIRQKFPDAEIEVHGHTDSTPIRYSGFRSNYDLSVQRAAAVMGYLVEKEGFKPERVSAIGHGDEVPVASNKTAAGRAKNRRAELVVTPAAK